MTSYKLRRRAFLAFATTLIVAPVALGSAKNELAPVYMKDAATAIPGRYIVAFEDGADRSSIQASKKAMGRLGGTIEHSFSNLNGMVATLPDRALKALRRNPVVKFIEADQVVSLPEEAMAEAPPPPPGGGAPWHLDRINQCHGTDGDAAFSTGAGSPGPHNIYVVSTGIFAFHSWFWPDTLSVMPRLYDDINDGVPSGEDPHGYGTYIASVAAGPGYGVAPIANIYDVRVLNRLGSGRLSGVIIGLETIIQDGTTPGVVVVALGTGPSLILDATVNNLSHRGFEVFVAAGNETDDACNYSPARAAAPCVLTVGALKNTGGSPASYSNFGNCVDIWEPGCHIGAWPTGVLDTRSICGTGPAAAFAALVHQGTCHP